MSLKADPCDGKTNHLYEIQIYKTGNKSSSLKFLPGRSATTINSCQTSRNPHYSGDEFAWKFTDASKLNNTYEFLDFYRYSTGENANIDLSKYTIKLTPKPGNPKIAGLYMQIGDQSMSPSATPGKSFVFDLSQNQVKQYLKGQTSKYYSKYKGVRTFTIFEFPKEQSPDNYFGKNNIVISTGPDFYELNKGQKTTSIKLSKLPDSQSYQTIELQNGDKAYAFIGGIAKKLLQQNNRNNINAVVNQRIDIEKKLPSQYILVTKGNPEQPNSEWRMFGLGWDKEINVVGNKNGTALIDGTQQSTHSYENTDFYKFFNGMLDIQSSAKNTKNDFAASIQGITFLNPPRRNQGTIQANSPFFPIVKANDWWTKKKNVTKRLEKAVQSYYDGRSFQFGETASANLFDNQIVGGWLGASDGIESGSPGLYSGRNFYHVSDDALKFLSKNQNFIENTIHQGAYGAPMSFAYGTGNGPIKNLTVDGLYLHRVTQPDGIIYAPNEDGGLIMDWFRWSKNTQDPNAKKKGGYGPATFKNIYIPSNKDQNINIEANALKSMGYISATNRPRNYENIADPGHYRAGGYTFKNSHSYIDIPVKMYARVYDGTNIQEIPIAKNTQDKVITKVDFPSDQGSDFPTIVNVYGASSNIIQQ